MKRNGQVISKSNIKAAKTLLGVQRLGMTNLEFNRIGQAIKICKKEDLDWLYHACITKNPKSLRGKWSHHISHIAACQQHDEANTRQYEETMAMLNILHAPSGHYFSYAHAAAAKLKFVIICRDEVGGKTLKDIFELRGENACVNVVEDVMRWHSQLIDPKLNGGKYVELYALSFPESIF